MFKSKKNSLFTSNKTSVNATTTSTFVDKGLKKTAQITSEEGSKKYSTTGNPFVDQFASTSRYKAPRAYEEIAKDSDILWSKNPNFLIRFILYLRIITRTVMLFNGTKTQNPQKGQGLKHESIFRMIWLHMEHPESFWKNIPLFISVGSWKDIFTMLSYDLQYNGWTGRKLDWNKFKDLLLAGLENPNTCNLIKKYLPQIKTNSRCTTIESQADNMIAKWVCSFMFGEKEKGSTYKQYRKLKSSGTAHVWQQLISQHKMLAIDFNTIHGRALAQLVSGKFLKNQGLEAKFEKWISSKPIAKYTGYVHELAQNISHNLKGYQKQTINAQFQQLVNVATEGLRTIGLRPISVLDCSGSMDSPMYIGNGQVGKLKSITVAMASAIFFDEMLQKDSPFKNTYLSFSNTTEMHQFQGSTFVDKFLNTPRRGWGGTNFQSVFEYFAKFKQNNPNVSEDQIPNFIVCFSDGEFNAVSGKVTTNVKAGRKVLKDAGFSDDYCENFGICFVDLPNTFYALNPRPKFETYGDVKNCFYFSGHDLSPLGFLFGITSTSKNGIPQTAEELFLAAMDQEVLDLVEV